MLYLSAKTQVRRIIDKHFPPEISQRFTLRSDSEIWLPKEDSSIWNRHKQGTESIHILFDGLALFEIPMNIKPQVAEWLFLKAFRNAIADGAISFDKRLEWTDNKTARIRKQQRVKLKREKVKEAFSYAKQRPNAYKEVTKHIETIGDVRIVQADGGEK